MSRPQPKIPPPRGQWSRRFGLYFLGVAIGLTLVGLLLSIRQMTVQGGPGSPPQNTDATPGSRP